MKVIKYGFAVRDFVNFIMRSGDLNTTYAGKNRGLEGTYAHQAIQSRLSEFYGLKYDWEVFLEKEFDVSGIKLRLSGRADGIIHEEDIITVDEIKSVKKDLSLVTEPLLTHWAQAEIYAYIYASDNKLEKIRVQITYCDPESLETKYFYKDWIYDDLQSRFEEMIYKFKSWSFFIKQWSVVREKAIIDIQFPFEYRQGQRKIAVEVYRAIRDKEKLYVQAPTGIGKTISVLFPAIKAIGEGLSKKAFYLTAKTITRTVAEDSLRLLDDNGLKFKSVTLTAKDKICFEKTATCNPEECKYAKGHFDRVNETIYNMLQLNDRFDRELIETYARHYRVCPFELQLDLTEWTDMVICDYNYVFDPRVYLKRFFDDKKASYSFLIDEAHNLVDRSREMYSASLDKERVMEIKKVVKNRSNEVFKKLEKINRKFLAIRKINPNTIEAVLEDEASELYGALREFTEVCDGYLQKEQDPQIHQVMLEFYFEVIQFIKISEIYDNAFKTLVKQPNKNQVIVKLYCLDPSEIIKDIINRNGSGIFFSATLLPINYYKKLLGGEPEDKAINLESPFDKSNFRLIVASDVSTRLKDRESSYTPIAKYLYNTIKFHDGNYIAFFPSYKYMERVYETFTVLYPEQRTIVQESRMIESEREMFLKQFETNPSDPVLGFCVLGGIFSEGIDLRQDRLKGTMIIGVGLPKISLEQNLIKDYFEKTHSSGYDYAYTYPGMSKVLQAAGRVIRTEEDRGIILLIGERFNYNSYRAIFPKHWFPNDRIRNASEINSVLTKFWE